MRSTFIEVTRNNNSEKVLLNVEHVLSVEERVNRHGYPVSLTVTMTNGYVFHIDGSYPCIKKLIEGAKK